MYQNNNTQWFIFFDKTRIINNLTFIYGNMEEYIRVYS